MIDLDLVQARADAALAAERDGTRDSVTMIRLGRAAAEVPVLVAELRAAREDRKELAFAVRDLLDWAKRTHSGIGPDPHPEEYFRTTEHAQRALEDHAPEEAR